MTDFTKPQTTIRWYSFVPFCLLLLLGVVLFPLLPTKQATSSSSSVVCSPDVAAAMTLMNDYSLMTLENLAIQHEIGGRAWVGGDFVSTNSATVGSRLPTAWTPATPSLVIAGQVINGNPLNIQRGALWVGDNNTIQQNGNQGRVNGRLINFNQQSAGVSTDATLATQTATFADTLNTASISLNQTLAENNPVTIPSGQPGPLIFTATTKDAQGVAVFRIAGTELFDNPRVQQIEIRNPVAAEFIIVQVTGNTLTWQHGNFVGSWLTSSGRGRTLWHFPEATTLNLGSRHFIGALLAPQAAVTHQGRIDGAVAVGSLDSRAAIEHTPLTLLSCPPPTSTPTATPVSPLPTPTPDVALTLADYTFGEPSVVITDAEKLSVVTWLPLEQELVIVDGESQWLQTFDSNTGQRHTYGRIGATYPKVAWLAESKTMAFLQTSSTGLTLKLATENSSQPLQPTERRLQRDALAGRGDRVMVLEPGASTPLLFDGAGNRIPLPPINLLDYGINQLPSAFFTPQLLWHPTEPKVAIYDRNGFVIFHVETGALQRFSQFGHPHPWAFSAAWSTDGEKIAIVQVQGNPPFHEMQLTILDTATDTNTSLALPLKSIVELAWALNGRQLLVAGQQQEGQEPQSFDILLVDTFSHEYRIVDLASYPFKPLYEDASLVWSPDGLYLFYRCESSSTEFTTSLCQSMVSMGKSQ